MMPPAKCKWRSTFAATGTLFSSASQNDESIDPGAAVLRFLRGKVKFLLHFICALLERESFAPPFKWRRFVWARRRALSRRWRLTFCTHTRAFSRRRAEKKPSELIIYHERFRLAAAAAKTFLLASLDLTRSCGNFNWLCVISRHHSSMAPLETRPLHLRRPASSAPDSAAVVAAVVS